MSKIDVQTLKKWRDENTEHQLIDVREPWEVEIGHINGLHIAMDSFLDSIEMVRRDIPWISHSGESLGGEKLFDAMSWLKVINHSF